MPSKKPRINFVTTEEIVKEMKRIADKNNRSMSKEIELLCKLHIAEDKGRQGTKE